MDIQLISLRSALSEQKDTSLNDSSKVFLEEINPEKKIVFTQKESLLRLFFVESGGSEAPFLKIYPKYKDKGPFFLLTTGANNSLASSLEILSYLKREGQKGEILFGEPQEIANRLLTLCQVYEAKSRLSHLKLAIIGKPSDWLIASNVDYSLLKKTYGVQMVNIEMKELLQDIEEAKDSKELPETFDEVEQNNPYYQGATRIYWGLKKLIQDNQLDGFSLRCFDLLTLKKNTACLALSLLNKEGYCASCEGDELALLSMAFIRALTGKSSFQCNPSMIDKEKNEIVLAHCAVPLDMVDKFSFFTHFESGIGIGIRGQFSLKEVTVFKISNDFKACHCYKGNIVENLQKENLCRSQIRVKFEEDISPLYQDPFGNHLLVVYGNFEEQLKLLVSL